MSKIPLDPQNNPLARVGTSSGIDDTKLRNTSFAGRIGGNQQFTVSRDDPDYDKIKSETPDAVANVTWKELCSLRGFREPAIWKSGLIELWGALGAINRSVLSIATEELTLCTFSFRAQFFHFGSCWHSTWKSWHVGYKFPTECLAQA